jgi:hypothetical protein
MRQYLDVQFVNSHHQFTIFCIEQSKIEPRIFHNTNKYFLETFNETFHTTHQRSHYKIYLLQPTNKTKPQNHKTNLNHSNMKYTALLASTTALLLNNALAMPAATTNNPAIISMPEALEAINQVSPPTGVSFTGAAEAIKEPDMKHLTANNNEIAATDDKQHESWFGHGRRHGFGHRWWGSGAFGAWGGWGGYGPYRFGFNCGGIPGWAYPLSFWNAYGADIYGGSCGLGFPYGGLYYC